jgi:hypothetical protein
VSISNFAHHNFIGA